MSSDDSTPHINQDIARTNIIHTSHLLNLAHALPPRSSFLTTLSKAQTAHRDSFCAKFKQQLRASSVEPLPPISSSQDFLQPLQPTSPRHDRDQRVQQYSVSESVIGSAIAPELKVFDHRHKHDYFFSLPLQDHRNVQLVGKKRSVDSSHGEERWSAGFIMKFRISATR